ncbi:MAG: hypothetical protein IJI05_02520 [Erysipelotrichaceae bacterium]|nr:hypothetical protein [Erysipelotrichaceae bacterium]
MVKRILASISASALINAAGSIINWIAFRNSDHLLLCIRQYGGEITVEQGFGTIASHIYPMTMEGSTSHNFRFSILMFVIWTVVIGGIIFLLMTAVHAVRKK